MFKDKKSIIVMPAYNAATTLRKTYDDHKFQDWGKYCLWGIFIAVLLLTIAIRIRLLPVPIERDEGEYACAGQLMLQGIPPYEKIYNMKMPGIYAIYALILAIFGQTHIGIHLGLLFVNVITVLLVFLLVKAIFWIVEGLSAGTGFALLSLDRAVLGYTANSEHFVIFFALMGILFLHKAITIQKWLSMLAAGLMLGTAYLMKQPGAAFIAFAGLYFLFGHLRRPVNWKYLMGNGVLLSAGILLPYAAACLILWKLGVFKTFWFWTFDYARIYIAQIPLTTVPETLRNEIIRIALSSIGLWALAGVGLIWLLVDRKSHEQKRFLILFLAFSFLAICPGFYFRPHYFILLLPAIAMLIGFGIAGLYKFFSRHKMPLVPVGLLFLAVACTFYQHWDYFFIYSPTKVSHVNTGLNPFPESLVIGKFIQLNSKPNETAAVLGSEPQIYFYSHRRPATGYIYTYALMENQPYALQMQEDMISQIEQASPKFLIFVHISTSWLVDGKSEKKIRTWSDQYIQKFYHPVGIVDIIATDFTVYRWGPEVASYKPRSNFWITILCQNRYSDFQNMRFPDQGMTEQGKGSAIRSTNYIKPELELLCSKIKKL